MGVIRTVGRAVLASSLSLGFLVAAGAPAYAANTVTCGSTITASGTYTVAADATCAGDGVVVSASYVTLRLQGHILKGTGLVGYGVRAENVTHFRLIGPGGLQTFEYGVYFYNVDDSVVQNVVTSGNEYGFGVKGGGSSPSERDTFTGNAANSNTELGWEIAFTRYNTFASNKAIGNTDDGFEIGPQAWNNTIQSNTATGNGGNGIGAESGSYGNRFISNKASGNTEPDLSDENGNCTSNKWSGNQYVTKDPACIT